MFKIVFVTIFALLIFNTHAVSANNTTSSICSSALGSDFFSCPSNKANYSKAQFTIPSYVACNSTEMLCIGDGYPYSTFHKFVTIYDVDDNATTKYKVSITPEVQYEHATHRGKITVSQVSPSNAELELGDKLAAVSTSKSEINKMFNIKIASNGSAIDSRGLNSNFIALSQGTCLTAFHYLNNDNNCEGNMNNDIRNSVEESAEFHAFSSALDKLSSVVEVVTRGRYDTSDFLKLSEFRVKMKYPDGSILSLKVSVIEGVVQIELDLLGSSNSRGVTFKSLLERQSYNGSTSLEEALSLAGSSLGMLSCRTVDVYSGTDAVVVERVVGKDEDGNPTVTLIYKTKDIYVSIQQC